MLYNNITAVTLFDLQLLCHICLQTWWIWNEGMN